MPFWFRTGGAIGASLLLGACAGPLSTLEPEGPSARGAAALWWIMLAGSVVIFLAVAALLAFAVARPRLLRDAGPARIILWGGIVIPTLILTALVTAALALGERLIALPREPAPLRIEVVARRWQWEFRYPGAEGLVTVDRLHIPAGRDVDFAVVSEDIIHAFWIPRLGGKIDAIPGHRNIVRLRADRPGVFGGVCAEFCGDGHPSMNFTVEAHPEDAYAGRLEAAASGEGGR